MRRFGWHKDASCAFWTPIVTCALGAIILGGVAWAEEDESGKFEYPVLLAPKMKVPPNIDGVIGQEEWRGAAAITGLASTGGVGPFSMVAEVQQVIWYIGYDSKYLYLAMHSPNPKGTYPKARVKENESEALLFEDHVEVQILTNERKDAMFEGKGFYKIMANPKGAVTDMWFFNGTPGSETLWSMGGPLKCHVTEDAWQLEMAVELKRMNIDSLDGRSLVMQLVRADESGGFYFAGLVPGCWTEWKRFARVDFAPDAPVFRYTKTGEVMDGMLDTMISVAGGSKPAEAFIEVSVENAEGKNIFRENRTLKLNPGESAEAHFKKTGIPITQITQKDSKRNWMEIKALSGNTVLYHNRQPFVALNGSYRTEYLVKWLAGRPQSGAWESHLAYLPYSGKAEAGVDLDFFGVPAEIQAAASFKVAIRPVNGWFRSTLAFGAAPIRDRTGSLLLDVPSLDDGDYEAVFQLLDSEGGRIAEQTSKFERRHYPFEHNTLGINEEVIPPFSPIAVKDRRLSVWGRSYLVGKGGLLDGISARMPTGQRGLEAGLLASPMRLLLKTDNKMVAAADAEVKFPCVAAHAVEIAGSQKLGDIRADISGTLEYDGWYGVKLTLTPEKHLVVESLDLLLELADIPADTLYIQRNGDSWAGNRFGAIPSSPGLFFESTELAAYCDRGKDWLSFVPVSYVGSGDRGLWFFAWSDAGWELRAEQPMMCLERLENGQVRMTVRLLAGPVTVDKPRNLRFAFQAAPMKPNNPRYRTLVQEGGIAHATPGYRTYGDSVDGYALHDERDFTALRRHLLYGTKYPEITAGNMNIFHERFRNANRIVLYGSTFMGGVGAPEHKTFGGEWLGRSDWKPRPDPSYANQLNDGGTIKWTSEEQLTPWWYNWTASYNDFFIWYHKPLMEKCGINGTWWDNASIGTIREYNPETGHMELSFNLWQRRQLLKRLNHLGWELMRPPFWTSNMHCSDMSFNQMAWQIENLWFSSNADYTSFDVWSLDQYRALTRTKTTMLVPKPSYGGFFRSWEKHPDPSRGLKIGRSLAAIQLLHDIVPIVDYTNINSFLYPLRRRLDALVDLPDCIRCLFTGYWNSTAFITPPDADIKVSFYSNTATLSTAVIFGNISRKDLSLEGTVLDVNKIISGHPLPDAPRKIKRIYDLETERDVAVAAQDGKWRINQVLVVPWHEYVVLAIEAE